MPRVALRADGGERVLPLAELRVNDVRTRRWRRASVAARAVALLGPLLVEPAYQRRPAGTDRTESRTKRHIVPRDGILTPDVLRARDEDQGLTLRQIAVVAGCGKPVVGKAARDAGIRLRPSVNRPRHARPRSPIRSPTDRAEGLAMFPDRRGPQRWPSSRTWCGAPRVAN